MEKENDEINVYCSCPEVEYFTMIIDGYIDKTDELLSSCCTLARDDIKCKITDNSEETINNFIEYRHNIIEENKRIYHTNNKERKYTTKCVNCPSYVVGNWSNRNDSKISYINLSIYPSPCQSKCLYCCFINSKYYLTDSAKSSYDKLFKFLSYVKTNNMLNENVVWQISSGEISVHPYKDKILELVDGMNVLFLSNCFVFDQGIANHLKKNPHSVLNLSIDSGTASTWKKVKGVDNFDIMRNNLQKYHKYCDQENHQQISFKYIILPRVNTMKKDFIGVIEIMKELGIRTLQISRNFLNDGNIKREYHAMMSGVISLATMCRENDLLYELHHDSFTLSEMNRINRAVNYNLQKKDNL